MKDLTYDVSKFESFDYTTMPESFFMVVLGQRRSGKSFLVNNLLQTMAKDKKRKPHAIFLISKTLQSDVPAFEGIPPNYKFDNMEVLENYIIPKQMEVRDINRRNKNKKHFQPIESKVVVVIDDFAVDGGLKNKTLEHLAKNGRHYSGEHGSLSIILLSQSLTAISRQVRLNLDYLVFNSLSSSTESEMVMGENGFFSMDTNRSGKQQGRLLYHNLVSMKDFRFIVLENFKQNKKDYTDYIKFYDATSIPIFKFFGTKEDWVDDDIFNFEADKQTDVTRKAKPVEKYGRASPNVRQLQNNRKPSQRGGSGKISIIKYHDKN